MSRKVNTHKISYGRCERTGKAKHLTRANAKKCKSTIEHFGNIQYPLMVYKCDYCGYFHLGSKLINGEQVTREIHKSIHK